MTLYLQVNLTAAPGQLDELSDTVRWVSAGMTRRGMILQRSFRSVDPEAATMINLWELPDANTFVESLRTARRHRRHAEVMGRLSEALVDEVVRFVEPAPTTTGYDPGRLPRHLHVTYLIQYGATDPVWDAMPAPPGWHLAGAFHTTVGNLCELFQFWELPTDGDPADLAAELPAMVRARSVLEMFPVAWSP